MRFFRNIGLTLLALSTAPALGQGVPGDDQSIEKLLLGSWDVANREFEYDNTKVVQTDGVLHVTDRLPDGTYTVLVTIATNISNLDGSDRPHPACNGESKCVQNGATEAIGVYSNGKFRVDYYGDNWLDDVFTVSGRKMSGKDLNGPIYMTKSR